MLILIAGRGCHPMRDSTMSRRPGSGEVSHRPDKISAKESVDCQEIGPKDRTSRGHEHLPRLSDAGKEHGKREVCMMGLRDYSPSSGWWMLSKKYLKRMTGINSLPTYLSGSMLF